MRLYEVDLQSNLFWVASEDEFDVLSLLRSHLLYEAIPEFSEEEVDEAFDRPFIKEINENEAASISVVDEFGDAMYTLWDIFARKSSPGLVSTDWSCGENENYIDY